MCVVLQMSSFHVYTQLRLMKYTEARLVFLYVPLQCVCVCVYISVYSCVQSLGMCFANELCGRFVLGVALWY